MHQRFVGGTVLKLNYRQGRGFKIIKAVDNIAMNYIVHIFKLGIYNNLEDC